jgi:hypothetical protein
MLKVLVLEKENIFLKKSAKINIDEWTIYLSDTMTRFDDILNKESNTKASTKKVLKLVLEEDDSIIKSIEQGMRENDVKEATIEDIDGVLKEAIITNMEKGKYNEFEIRETQIIRASGLFKFGGDDLWGSLNVFTGGRKPISGKLTKGTAMDGFEIKLLIK